MSAYLTLLPPAALEVIKKHNALYKRHVILEIGGTTYEVLPMPTTIGAATSVPVGKKNVTGIYIPYGVKNIISRYSNAGYGWISDNAYSKPSATNVALELARIDVTYAPDQDVKKILTEAFVAKIRALKNNTPLPRHYDLICGNVPLNHPGVEDLMREYCKQTPNSDICACLNPTSLEDAMKLHPGVNKDILLKKLPCFSEKCKTGGYIPPSMSGSCDAQDNTMFYVIIFFILLILLVVFGYPIVKKRRSKNKKQSRIE